jgi:hypothetical protein
MSLHTGALDAYHWLTTDDHELTDLIRLCPETVPDKYIAVTSIDGAALQVTDQEKAAGWETRTEIAYSPRIKSTVGLPHENRHGCCVGFDESYAFDKPVDLGERSNGGNIFEATLTPGRVEIFVGFLGFAFKNVAMKPITESLLEANAVDPTGIIHRGR